MRICLTLFLSLCAICLQAQNVDAIFSKANKNYNLGSYKEALKGYDSIVQLGVHSPELYFNMGNAHYKLNRIAPSILSYEKAQLLDPTNEDIQHNLRFAQNMTIDVIEELPPNFIDSFVAGLSGALSLPFWSVLIIVLFALACLSFVAYLQRSRSQQKRRFFALSLLLGILSLSSFGLAWDKQLRDAQQSEAIIFAQTTDFRSEPNLRSEVLVQLHEGTKVIVEGQVEQWVKVRLANGTVGWLTQSDVQRIAF